MIFDGREFAKNKTMELRDKIAKLGRAPRLVIFQVGEDKASDIFVGLKKKKGEELGVVVDHIRIAAGDEDELLRLVGEKNKVVAVDGIMVQLPAVGIAKDKVEVILHEIDPKKDADGQNPKSGVMPAVLRAVSYAFLEYQKSYTPKKVAVVGSKGYLGSKICEYFVKNDLEVMGVDLGDETSLVSEADLIVLTSGKAGVVSEEIIKQGAGVIDLGAPVAEFANLGLSRVGFLTPVPGGIGPVTVISLFESLYDLVFERESGKIGG